MIIRLIKTVTFIALFSAIFSTSFAKDNVEIIATVNDAIISNIDVKDRIDLTISQSGLSRTNDVLRKIKPQILQTLIDEELQRQEADKLNISISDFELDEALKQISARNKIKYANFKKFIEDKGMPFKSFKSQIRSQLIWNKIIAQKVRPRLIVTEREIDEEIEQISNSTGISEVKISKIFLPFNTEKTQKNKVQTQELAEELYEEIEDGANFENIAKEFSKNITSKEEWKRQNNIDPEIEKIVMGLQINEVSKPFMTKEGYYIIKLDGRRAFITPLDNAKIKIRQAAFVTGDGAPEDAINRLAQELSNDAKSIKSCNDFVTFAKKHNSAVSSEEINTTINDVNPQIKSAVINLPKNKVSSVVKSSSALHMFIVCDRDKIEPAMVIRDNLKEAILRKKLELSMLQYMQSLRRSALIEIR